jgi:hypothetical protein
MSKPGLYTIISCRKLRTARLGWVSPSTGLTYCGICLRAPVTPAIGAECSACGAHVAGLFEMQDGEAAVRHAWRQALLMAQPELRPS